MLHGIIFYIDQPIPFILDFGGFVTSWISGFFFGIESQVTTKFKKIEIKYQVSINILNIGVHLL